MLNPEPHGDEEAVERTFAEVIPFPGCAEPEPEIDWALEPEPILQWAATFSFIQAANAVADMRAVQRSFGGAIDLIVPILRDGLNELGQKSKQMGPLKVALVERFEPWCRCHMGHVTECEAARAGKDVLVTLKRCDERVTVSRKDEPEDA